MRKKKKGLTIVEVLVVLTIMAIAAGSVSINMVAANKKIQIRSAATLVQSKINYYKGYSKANCVQVNMIFNSNSINFLVGGNSIDDFKLDNALKLTSTQGNLVIDELGNFMTTNEIIVSLDYRGVVERIYINQFSVATEH